MSELKVIGRIRLTWEGGPWFPVVEMPGAVQIGIIVKGVPIDVYANVKDLISNLNEGWVYESSMDVEF